MSFGVKRLPTGDFRPSTVIRKLSDYARAIMGAYSHVHDSLKKVSFARVWNRSERLWLHARTVLVALENYPGCPRELFWLPWGIVLVGQGNRIEAIQNLPDVRFLFLPPFAHACYLCREVNKIWQYRTGGNLTILTKIMTLRREADRKQRRSLRLPMEIKRT